MFGEESVFLQKMLKVKWCLEELLFIFFEETICKVKSQDWSSGICQKDYFQANLISGCRTHPALLYPSHVSVSAELCNCGS